MLNLNLNLKLSRGQVWAPKYFCKTAANHHGEPCSLSMVLGYVHTRECAVSRAQAQVPALWMHAKN